MRNEYLQINTKEDLIDKEKYDQYQLYNRIIKSNFFLFSRINIVTLMDRCIRSGINTSNTDESLMNIELENKFELHSFENEKNIFYEFNG